MKNNLLPASTALSLVYGLCCEHYKSAPVIAAKVLSTFLLAYHSHLYHPNPLMTKALLAHCCGDLIIELSPHAVLCAIPAFLVGHLLYLWQLKNSIILAKEINATKYVALSSIAVYSAYFTQLLASHTTGVVQGAVLFYCAALTTLLAMTVLQKQNSTALFLSAALYIASDTLIGVNQFVGKIPGSNYATWGMYYAGQRCLKQLFETRTDDIAPTQ